MRTYSAARMRFDGSVSSSVTSLFCIAPDRSTFVRDALDPAFHFAASQGADGCQR